MQILNYGSHASEFRSERKLQFLKEIVETKSKSKTKTKKKKLKLRQAIAVYQFFIYYL